MPRLTITKPMQSAVLHTRQFRTSLRGKTTYKLSPCDAFLGGVVSVTRALFTRSQLDWGRLCNALERIEAVYPPLCGRHISNEVGERVLLVDPNEENGFGAVETEVDNTLAGIRSSGAIVSSVHKANSYMNWPFFLERSTEDPVVNDAGSLFGVHLTRAKDGCILSFSLRHLVCDGARMVQLMIDVSRAYRGLEIAEKHLDRSLMWPDQYLSRCSVPSHSPESYPRRFVERPSPSHASELNLAQLHVPQASIDKMKALTKGRLRDAEYVSTNDLLTALCWMLRAEFRSKLQPATVESLEIPGTCARSPMNVGTSCVTVVPANYFGNALVRFTVSYPPTEPVSQSLLDVFARMASLVRQTVNGLQTDPEAAVEGLLVAYTASCTTQPSTLGKGICIMATQAKMPFDQIDFGHSSPSYVYMPPPRPCFANCSDVEVNTNGDGVLLYIPLNQTERKILESSRILEECAPGAKLFHEELTEEDAIRIMRLEVQD